MICLCPYCWTTISATTTWCPACGADLMAATSYDAKLTQALGHPVAETRALAATIIGQRRVMVALPHLIVRLGEEADMGALVAIVIALGRLGDCRASVPLRQRLAQPMPMVAALECITALAALAHQGCGAAQAALAEEPPMNLPARVRATWADIRQEISRGGEHADSDS
jgi:hypothetical protein